MGSQESKPKVPQHIDWTNEGEIPTKMTSSPLFDGKNTIKHLQPSSNIMTVNTFNLKTKKCHRSIAKNENVTINDYTYNEKIYFVDRNVYIYMANKNQFYMYQLVLTSYSKHILIWCLPNDIWQKCMEFCAVNINQYDDDDDDNDRIPIRDDQNKINVLNYQQILNKRVICSPYDIKGARIVTVAKGKDKYIYIMGIIGRGDNKKFMEYPHDEFWRCRFLEQNNNKYEWEKCFLPKCMHSFGLINFENKYLITFGGISYNMTLDLIPINSVFALDLNNNYWYELPQLQEKGSYDAVYDMYSSMVYLFSNNGEYYRIKMDGIIALLTQSQCYKVGMLFEMPLCFDPVDSA